MLLTRLKYWRELRGYSVREIADKSKVGFTTISFLENKHRPPHGTTARKLAAALDVGVTDLYEQGVMAGQQPTQTVNDNKTVTPVVPTRAKANKPPAGNFWMLDQDGYAFGPFEQEQAERLKDKLGGQHQARVYEAASKAEARELHRAFLVRVARGHDAW